MADLVTLAEAVEHLRVDAEPPDAADIAAKISAASAAVLERVTKPEAADWTAETVPFDVKAAALLVLGGLYDGEDQPFGKGAERLLLPHRKPVLQ